MTTVITVRGTGEVLDADTNMLAQVVRKLGRMDADFDLVDLPYPATISFANAQKSVFGVSGDRSVILGVEMLRQMFSRAGVDDKFVLLGYSLGALVISKFLETAEPNWLVKIQCVGNIANPMRIPGQSIGSESVGFGLAGPRQVQRLDPVVFEVANPDDFITSAARNSLFRPFVEEILAFSVSDPGPAAVKFFGDTILGKNEIPLQALWDGRLDQAVTDGRGYLGSSHTTDYGLSNWNNGNPITGIALLAETVRDRI